MKILLYNPDNGVTQNFMPHLWMFLLQSLTPPGHEVLLIDGNTQPMTDAELVEFARAKGIGLVGIGAMTRMIAKAYRVADALRAAGFPVVMGGPHVTEVPDEALGREGGPRHADAMALGEADETWPRIVADAAAGRTEGGLCAGGCFRPGTEAEPSGVPADPLGVARPAASSIAFRASCALSCAHFGYGWETFHLIPIESGRGCPYGCEFCTVTGFFGDSIRFRTNQSIVDELLRLKARARSTRGQVAVFFVDDNFAINVKRTKSLLRDIIAAGAQVNWVAQISANLLRDEELVDLIAESGGKWIFIGMESLDPANLASVTKSVQQARGICRRVLEAAGAAQRLRHHFVHLRPGPRYRRRRRAHAGADPHLASGLARFRPDHALPRHAAIYPTGARGPPDPAKTLAGIRAFSDGAHAAPDEHFRGRDRSSRRME